MPPAIAGSQPRQPVVTEGIYAYYRPICLLHREILLEDSHSIYFYLSPILFSFEVIVALGIRLEPLVRLA